MITTGGELATRVFDAAVGAVGLAASKKTRNGSVLLIYWNIDEQRARLTGTSRESSDTGVGVWLLAQELASGEKRGWMMDDAPEAAWVNGVIVHRLRFCRWRASGC